MKGYSDNLERLGQPIGQNLVVSLILVFLNKDFDSFVQNYNMHDMRKTVNELHDMLKLHEETLPKKDTNPALHAIRAGRVQKNQKNKPYKAAKGGHGKGNGKMGYVPNNAPFSPKPKTPPPPKKDNPGLRGSKKLKPGALILYMGDGHRAAVEAIGTYHLEPPILKNNLVYFMAIPRNGIFELDMSCSNTNDSSMYAISNKRAKINLDSSLLWHCRLGHISKKRIEKLQHDGLLNSIDIVSLGKCVSCLSGKMTRKPYSHQVERAKDLLGLIHTDVCGPFKIMSRQGASYFVTFTDNFSRYGYVYLLKHKHEVFETFKDYALETAARILNMVPTKKVDKTPYEIWHGQAPKLSYLKVWGYEALVKHDTLTKPDKLDPRSFRCIYIGYPKETMGYSFYNPSENNLIVARNAEFFENDLIDLNASGSVEDLELIQEEVINPSVDTSLNHEEDDQEIDEPQSDINPIHRSTRTRRPTDRLCLYIDAEEHKLGDLGEPANYKAALLDPESKKWLEAMIVEMQSMKDNDVWVLVDLPPNARTFGSKWLFKKKTDMDGAVYIFKAPIRILIAIAAYYDYEIWQMDVKTAFLNRHLSEEVYMEQPEGFVNPKYPNHVCKLKHSIYGLKQASRQLNKQFDDEIKKFSFTQNLDEPCVYLKASGSYVAILILYVDDILLIGNNIPMLQDVKSYLGRSFAMKDLGDAAYILGIKIYHNRSKRLIGLCRKAYIEKILKRYYMENSKRGTIPMQEKLKLSKSQGASTPAEKQRMQNIPYTSAIGSIIIRVKNAVKNILKYLRNTKDMFLASIVPTIEEPISMYCDNTGAIAIAKDDRVTKGARHFRVKVHYLRETIKLGDVKIEKIDIDDNLAGPFIKALAFPKHSELTRNIGLLPASSFM
ncbi:retrotransposon protein, putative, ty1-copia subclass [Tanacetum coccineum]